MNSVFINSFSGGTPPNEEGVEVDHIFGDMMKVMYKLSLIDQLFVTNLYEEMWDADELCTVKDHVGYKMYWGI
jgi:hypothetical protein